MGPVRLAVRDLDREVAFYGDALGLPVLRREGDAATLGVDEPVLVLEHAPDAPSRPPRTSGLFHVAILLPTRAALGALLRRFLERRVPLQGASDHRVSEAIYLADAEGNGLEVYADRPREAWRDERGRFHMTTEPLDVEDLLAQADAPGARLPEGTRVGHVHLNVGDVARAEAFYGGALGFDLMARYGDQASFLSAGGYHHHVAANVWNGRGAPPPPPGALGLREFTVLTDADAVRALADRLDLDEEAGAVRLRDPAGNALRVARGA